MPFKSATDCGGGTHSYSTRLTFGITVGLGKRRSSIGSTSQLFIADIVQADNRTQNIGLVYGITDGDGSGYNRKNGVQLNTKSKVEGAIIDEEYRSPEAEAGT